MRLLLLADLHLGARCAQDEARRRAGEPATGDPWTQAVAFAIDPRRNIDAVVCAGDLFDHPLPAADLVAGVAEGAAALLGAGRGVVLLPGAYDGLAQPNGVYSSRAFPQGTVVVDWVEPRRVEIPLGSGPLQLYAAAARPGSKGIDAALLARQDTEGCHLGLLHGLLGKPGSGDPPCLWGRPEFAEDFFAACGLDLVMLGGGHDYLARRQGGTLVVQPGAMRENGRGDPARHGFLIADMDGRSVQVAREGQAAGGSLPPSLPRAPQTAVAGEDPELDESLIAALRGENSMRGLFVRRLEARAEEGSATDREALARAMALGVSAWAHAEAAHVD